jgi:DNA-binding CsgD family transcriptional regulator
LCLDRHALTVVSKQGSESEGRRDGLAALSERERRLAELVVSGLGGQEIARALLIGTETVEWSLTKLCRKLGVGSSAELEARLRYAKSKEVS